jgi:hypothetical protein
MKLSTYLQSQLLWRQSQEDHKFKASPGQTEHDPVSKTRSKMKGLGWVAQVVQHLPSMLEDLGSIANAEKEGERERERARELCWKFSLGALRLSK